MVSSTHKEAAHLAVTLMVLTEEEIPTVHNRCKSRWDLKLSPVRRGTTSCRLLRGGSQYWVDVTMLATADGLMFSALS